MLGMRRSSLESSASASYHRLAPFPSVTVFLTMSATPCSVHIGIYRRQTEVGGERTQVIGQVARPSFGASTGVQMVGETIYAPVMARESGRSAPS
jgi:hypothetical protein